MLEKVGFRIGLCAAVGAGLVWMIAYAAGFQSWLVAVPALILGSLLSFLLVGPRQTWSECKLVIEAIRKWFDDHRENIAGALAVIAGIAMFVLALATNYYSYLHLKDLTGLLGTSDFPFVSLLLAVVFIVLILPFVVKFRNKVFSNHCHSVQHWLKRFEKDLAYRSLQDLRTDEKIEKTPLLQVRARVALFVGLFFVPYTLVALATVSVVYLTFLTLDLFRVFFTACGNAFLRLFSVDRIAAALGAFTGGSYTLIQYWGASQFVVPLLVAMALGGATGYLLFRLREVCVAKMGKTRLVY